MPKTVKVFGHQVPRGAVIASVVGVVGIGGWELYKHATKPQTGTTASDQGQGQGQYGYGYGGYGQYAYGQYVPYASQEQYGYGEYGYGYYGQGGGYYGSGFPVTPPGTQAPTSNNQEWVQAAVQAMVGAGFSQTKVATALGLYINGKAVTAEQEQLITTATGLVGDPPQDGVGGFPPAIHTTSTHHNPKPTEVTVPKVTGERYITAAAKLKTVGLEARRAVPNVGIVQTQNPKAGSKVAKGDVVVLWGQGSPMKKGK